MSDNQKDQNPLAPAAQILSLESLKISGGMPGQLPPVKRTITWQRGEDDTVVFETFIRKKSYRDMAEIYEGEKKFSSPLVISKLICDAKGNPVFSEDAAYDLHEDLINLIMNEIALVSGYGKKKQAPGKKSK